MTVNEYWSKRVNGTTIGVMEAADSGAGGGAVAACGVSRRGPALECSRAPESGKSRGVCVRSIGVCSVSTDG